MRASRRSAWRGCGISGRRGKTIFFVTHAPWQMMNFCDRVMWLHQGRVVGYDTAERMIPAYVAFTREWTQLDQLQRTQLLPDYETYRAQVGD